MRLFFIFFLFDQGHIYDIILNNALFVIS